MMEPKVSDAARADTASLGKSVVIKGELSGSEDLYVDGQVDGSIDLAGNRLTIGPNGRVKANVTARSVSIGGRLEGNVRATDRVDLRQTAVVLGDIATQRIAIEDGAYFKGGVDIQREPGKPQAPSSSGVKAESKPAATVPGNAVSVASATAGSTSVEPRK
jgi:cytoskeletal protein CcmA (bactofilin family)